MSNLNLEPPVSENTYGGVRGRLRWVREVWTGLSIREKLTIGLGVAGAGTAAVVEFSPASISKGAMWGAYAGVSIGSQLERGLSS